MQHRFLTVEREIQNLTVEAKQGRHLAEGLKVSETFSYFSLFG